MARMIYLIWAVARLLDADYRHEKATLRWLIHLTGELDLDAGEGSRVCYNSDEVTGGKNSSTIPYLLQVTGPIRRQVRVVAMRQPIKKAKINCCTNGATQRTARQPSEAQDMG